VLESESEVLNFLTLESELESHKKQGLRIPGRRYRGINKGDTLHCPTES